MFAVFRTELESPGVILIALCFTVFFGWRVYRGHTRFSMCLLLFSCAILISALIPPVARVHRAFYEGKDQFEWLAQLKDEGPGKQQEAIAALCVILQKGDLHNDPWWHAHIAKVLGHYGPEAKSAIPTLKTLLSDEDERVRDAALEAIRKIDPEEFVKLKK